MITFSVHRKDFQNGSPSYCAQVQSQGTLDIPDVVERMARHGSTVTEMDAAAALSSFFFVAEDLLLDGYRINTPFGVLAISIRGGFENDTASYEQGKQYPELILVPTTACRQKVGRRAQVQRRRASQPQPTLSSTRNPNNGAADTTLTPGGGAHLYGELLNFDPNDPKQGIFITPANGTEPLNGDAEPIRVEVVLRNSSRELAFLVPTELATGEHTIEVRRLFGKTDIRKGVLKETLTVE
ncbi:MAG TPA: DUF4469 domain-containing protein [Anaerolineae bacterium]